MVVGDRKFDLRNRIKKLKKMKLLCVISGEIFKPDYGGTYIELADVDGVREEYLDSFGFAEDDDECKQEIVDSFPQLDDANPDYLGVNAEHAWAAEYYKSRQVAQQNREKFKDILADLKHLGNVIGDDVAGNIEAITAFRSLESKLEELV